MLPVFSMIPFSAYSNIQEFLNFSNFPKFPKILIFYFVDSFDFWRR